LRRVLEYVNAGAWWMERNGLLVFGDKEKVQACIESREPAGEISNEAVREAQAIRSQVIASRGRRTAARRVTIGKLPPESTKAEIEHWLVGLAPDKREQVTKYILGSLLTCKVDPETGISISREEDNLDAALALDMLDQLEKSFTATKEYRALRIQHASPWVQQYFEEAHRCYIHGFEVACAVLCRGLLEAVLTDLVDPTYSLTLGTGNCYQSHLSVMIEAAKGTLLSQEGVSSAEMIRKCGNSAIHDLKTFREQFAPRLGQVVEETRRIVSRLYK
jgi:hypothetical protein